MKLKITLIVAVFLSVLLQLSVFASWSMDLIGGHASPQLFVVLVMFLLFEFEEDYVWYFAFVYYLFNDLIVRPAFPGMSTFLILLSILAIKLLREMVFKKSVFSNLLFFVLFSSYYLVLIYRGISPLSILSQVLVNLIMLLALYPFLYLAAKFLKSSSATQLSLKL